jgi:hypothetical protein
MYFLMTDVGAVPEVGLEHFRARSRELPVEPGQRPQWEQTAVVVDIGGGTTDIAVLRHILVDETPDRPDLPPDQVGRFYALYPEVVGVSGHRMLGGHYLTLRVFYWLKAAILDELLKRGLLQPLGKGKLTGGLAARVVSGAPPREVVPKEVGDILREALPTTWDEQHVPADEDGFDAFWRKAEELKLALSAGEPQDLDTREVQELIESINPKHRGRENVFGELWTDGPLVDLKNLGVELGLVDFERLVHPGLKTAASLAADLVGKVLENRRATGLDRILLTGQTSQMDLVARTIRAELQGLSHAGRVIPTPEPEVERARPKLAASLGAAYFERVIEFARGRDDPAVLEHGRTEVDVRAGDLHRALPNDFVVEGHLGEETLFRLGEPFREVDSAGRRAVRSGFRPFTAYTHSLYRAYGTEQIPWSSFSITGHAGHDGRPKFDPGVWGREGSMHVMVELDDSCTPALYFCNGDTPRVVAPTGGVPFRPRSAGLFDAENYLTALPEISVRTGGYGDPVTRVLVEAGPAESIGLPTLQVHRSDAPTSPHVLGWVLPDLPPLSRETGEYEFVVDHGGSTQRLPPIRPEGGRGARYRYRALLTADAVLHVFRGELRFVEAATFTLCEEFPGSVWTPRLTATPRPSESDWNPFSGRH